MATTNLKPELENVINSVEETPISSIKESITEIINEAKEELEKPKKSKAAKATKKSLPKKSKAKEEPKAKAVKDTVKAQKTSIIEKVVSEREVKWIYPEDINTPLARKSWRQKQRNKIHKLERALYRIEDQNSKEYKAAYKELEAFRKEVLKPGQAI